MNFVIDIGNTQVKSAVINEGEIIQSYTFPNLSLDKVKAVFSAYTINKCILSTTQQKPSELTKWLELNTQFIYLNQETPVNFKNLYGSKNTLGKDRIALTAAAQHEFPKDNVLVIDVGTCITYDFKSAEGAYLGGAISPGLEMRFKALPYFTSRLPLVTKRELNNLIGQNTEESILSGVLGGLIQEVDGVINQYSQRFENLNVVLTGGDELFFAKRLKNGFFARPYFLLKGLNAIAEFNA